MKLAGYRPSRAALALVGIAILAAALYAIGGSEVIVALRRCNPVAIGVAAGAIAIGTVLGAWNCYRIAELQGTMRFRRFLPIYWRSWAIGITLPGQVADFLATLWQLKGRFQDLSLIAGRLIVDKAVTLGLTLLLASLLPMLIGGTGLAVPLMLVGALCMSAVLGLGLINLATASASPLARHSWISRILPAAAAARNTPPALIVGNGLITAAKLAVSGIAYWVVLRSIDGATPDLLTTTAIAQSAGLVAYLPISFNGLGTVEVSAIGLFHSIGLDSAGVLSAYLILRVATLVMAWAPTAVMTLSGAADAHRK